MVSKRRVHHDTIVISDSGDQEICEKFCSLNFFYTVGYIERNGMPNNVHVISGGNMFDLLYEGKFRWEIDELNKLCLNCTPGEWIRQSAELAPNIAYLC